MRSTAPADAALGDHLQHPRFRKERHVTIEAPGGHIIKLSGELGRGERPVAKKRLDDA